MYNFWPRCINWQVDGFFVFQCSKYNQELHWFSDRDYDSILVYIYQPLPPPFSTFIPSLNSYIKWKNTIHLLKNFNVTKFNDVMSQVFTCQWNRCNEKNGSFNHLHIEYIHIALKVESLTSYKSSFQSFLSGNLSVVVPSFVITWTTTASPVYMSRSAADINTSFTRFTTFSFDKETLWTFCWFFKPIWKKDWNW